MANGDWINDLKSRCEAVGWDVSRTRSGHWKVRTGLGRSFVLSGTPGSNNRSKENALAEARRHGLEQLEAKLSERRERERLERIKTDRTAVGDALERALIERDAVNTARLPESKSNGAPALGDVDGVVIEAISPAAFTSPLHPGRKSTISEGEELLLADGRVVYRCVKPAAMPTSNPDAEGVCYRIFESVGSLRSHVAFHARTVPLNPLTGSVKARQDGETGQRSRIDRVIAEVDRQRSEAEAGANAKRQDEAVAKTPDASAQLPGIISRIVELERRIVAVRDELEATAGTVDSILGGLEAIGRELPDHLTNDEMIEKARRYDELKKLIG